MSFEAYVDLPPAVTREAAIDLLTHLAFKKVDISPFWNTRGAFRAFDWSDQRDYRSYTGVYAELADQDGHLVVYIRTNISASYWDIAKQNECLKELRSRLRGSFQSDVGKNRYFPLPKSAPEPAESGCLMAFERFDSNIERAIMYLMNRKFPKNFRTGWDAKLLGGFNPWILSNNLLLPYLVAAMEDYFKSTYVALLRYSTRKESVLKTARLTGEHLARISDGSLSVEEAFVEGLPFQNLRSISETFRALEPKIDVHGILQKPFRRRKVSLYDSVMQVVQLRHEFIHRGDIHVEFDDSALEKAMRDVQSAVDRVYQKITAVHSWPYVSAQRTKIQMHWSDPKDDGA